MKKRIASLFTSLLMIVSLMVVMPTMSVSAAGFVPRTSAPTSDNSYYYVLNPFYKSGYGMPNCTAYAYGRAYEILGSKPNLSTGNAGKWWWQNKTDGAYKYGNTPRLGAVACWDKYDQNQGHVAVVEAIDGSSVTISESHYKSTFFDTRTINSDSSNYLTSMRFLGYIYLGDYSVSIPGKSAINVKTGTSYKSTTFNWTASSNTKVYSIKIHKNGTLFKENTTAATSWSVILPVGDYEAYVDSCNDSGYTCSNTVKFTIEKGNPVPSSTTVSASAGTNYTPTSISWLKTANTNEYDVKIWRGTAQKGEAYKILWGEKGTSCLVDLPAGYYEAYVDSRNDYECSMSANIVKFTVTDGNYLDIGDDFYASIIKYDGWATLAAVNGNVEIAESAADASQIWHFIRQEDNSYVIYNCKSNKALDVDGAGTSEGTNVQEYQYWGSDAQKWYIYGRWSGEYILRPKNCDKVLDVYLNNNDVGANVQLWTYNGNDSQKFAFYNVEKAKPSVISVKAGNSVTNTTFSWTTADNATSYNLRINKGSPGATESYKDIWSLNTTSYSITLPEGYYEVYVDSCNFFSCDKSNIISFTIEKGALPHIHSYKSEISKQPTCITDGVRKYTCSGCGDSYTETIPATGHNYGDFVVTKPATCTEDGVKTKTCANCNDKITESISKTGHVPEDEFHFVKKNEIYKCYFETINAKKCIICGEIISSESIGRYEHTSSDWIIDKNAAINVKGSKHKECTVCKKVLETAEIPALSRISISKASVTLSTSTYAYDGKAKKPGVTVKLNGKTLKNGTDYTVSYSNNTKVGTAKVTITGKGNYTGSVSKAYSIKNDFKKATVSGISTKAFTGKNITQSITVKYNGKTLKNGTDYTVSYSSNKNIGTATVKITGKGSYTGTITKTFKINPAKQEIQKLTAKSKAFFVDWAQKGSASGYEIQYATNSKFTSAKKVTITNNKTDKATVSKLSGKKKYYVRVRSYTTVKGTKYYGAWSASKSVTTKK